LTSKFTELDKQIKESKLLALSNLLTNLETHYQQTLKREESLRKAFALQKAETLTQNESGDQLPHH